MVDKSARRTHRTYNATFKVQVALAVLREDKILAQLASQFEVHPRQILDLEKALTKAVIDECRSMIGPKQPLPLSQQTRIRASAEALFITCDIKKAQGNTPADLALMRRIDALHRQHPALDGKDTWRGNVFVERLCRSVRCECVYLKDAYDSVQAAHADITDYL